MLSDALHSFGRDLDEETLKVLAHGTLTPAHAVAFCGYVKIVRSRFGIEAILKGEAGWPHRVEDRDLLVVDPSLEPASVHDAQDLHGQQARGIGGSDPPPVG